MQTCMKMRPNGKYNAEIIKILQLPDENLKKNTILSMIQNIEGKMKR